MKANQSQNKATQAHSDHSEHAEEWTADDPLWQLMDEATPTPTDAFFARNVVRAARQMEPEKLSLAARLTSIFTAPRLAMAGAACAVALITWQMLPSSDQNLPTNPTLVDNDEKTPVTQPDTPLVMDDDTSLTQLSDLVVAETLSAAADDPTIFTRDELVTILGL